MLYEHCKLIFKCKPKRLWPMKLFKSVTWLVLVIVLMKSLEPKLKPKVETWDDKMSFPLYTCE